MNISLKQLSRISLLIVLLHPFLIFAQSGKELNPLAEIASAMTFRSIGPAYASGRIADIEVNPENHSEYYIAAAAGGIWKTQNAGITFKPIFDKYGSYSTSDVAVNPNNTNEIWVGTGEYNSQRAIGYGDGVYLSLDGGKSFKNVGLRKSEHIGRIVIDPRNSAVYVAAQGSLWASGGERGLYKTTDKGKTWNLILEISEHTGITDVVLDPRNPDVLYAASYQRRRRVFTLIDGGTESAIYKSEDAGKTWRKLTKGLPSGDVGRIGLAISPVNPDFLYAIIELPGKTGGFYRSTDRGESWTKESNHISSSPQYYNRLHCDPQNPEKVFSTETQTCYTLNGGKTWINLGLKNKHVDDHALWIDPDDTNHLIIGGDGGIYETFDLGKNWRHAPNLPVTQFYRLAVDNHKPFYNICAGTQDNNSMTGPAQTICKYGILNEDWTTTVGGDGFFAAFDPKDPNIIYSEYQFGGLYRYDKRSGEKIDIKPSPSKDEAYRWNWNAPLLVSHHLHTRLYFAANKLFRSDDRGNSWQVISPDLTAQIDRNKLKVMGKIQSPEAVAKSASTSYFGNIVSLSESKLNENLLYVGTDDGLIQITENGGESWIKYDSFGELPKMTYVSCVTASQHDENVVYAAFDGRKNGDFKPYLYKSTNKGKSWTYIGADLPENGTVHSIVEDYKDKNLLFAGTEFGVFASADAGKTWTQLKKGLPTVAVRDIKIQEDEDDLVLATFGRGIYILDDFSPLRYASADIFKQEAYIFPVKDALMYVRTGVKYGQGATYYAGKNPAYGAVFTYYLKDNIQTKKQIRKQAEKDALKSGKDIDYPTFDRLRAEDDERKPYLIFTIRDENGAVVRRITAPATKGVHRLNWGLRKFNKYPVKKEKSPSHDKQGSGMPVMPGRYSVRLSSYVNGSETELCEPVEFNAVPVNNTTLPAKDRRALAEFQDEAAAVQSAFEAVNAYVGDLEIRIGAIRTALMNAPKSTAGDIALADDYLQEIKTIKRQLTGDKSISKRYGSHTPSLSSRISTVTYGIWNVTSEPTQTMRDNLELVRTELKKIITKTKSLSEKADVLNELVKKAGGPATPCMLPDLD